jgi:hypothetical protein
MTGGNVAVQDSDLTTELSSHNCERLAFPRVISAQFRFRISKLMRCGPACLKRGVSELRLLKINLPVISLPKNSLSHCVMRRKVAFSPDYLYSYGIGYNFSRHSPSKKV